MPRWGVTQVKTIACEKPHLFQQNLVMYFHHFVTIFNQLKPHFP
jgi:hypothetical protein